jgi:hypothetical protein
MIPSINEPDSAPAPEDVNVGSITSINEPAPPPETPGVPIDPGEPDNPAPEQRDG